MTTTERLAIPVICCDCGALLERGGGEEPGEPPSRGICPSCAIERYPEHAERILTSDLWFPGDLGERIREEYCARAQPFARAIFEREVDPLWIRAMTEDGMVVVRAAAIVAFRNGTWGALGQARLDEWSFEPEQIMEIHLAAWRRNR